MKAGLCLSGYLTEVEPDELQPIEDSEDRSAFRESLRSAQAVRVSVQVSGCLTEMELSFVWLLESMPPLLVTCC